MQTLDGKLLLFLLEPSLLSVHVSVTVTRLPFTTIDGVVAPFTGSDPTLRHLAVLALESMGPQIVYEQEATAGKQNVRMG
jgi:hypothetical protein